MIKRLIKKNIVSNAGWLICGKIIQMLIQLFVGMLTVRYLGPDNYGLINYAGAYVGFFYPICTLGINSVLVKEFVDNKGKEGKIIGTSLGLRGVSSFLSVVAMVTVSFVLDTEEPITIVVVALASIGVIFQNFEIFNYWFQSRLESKKTAIAILVSYSITTLYKIILLLTQKSVLFFAFATSIDYISNAIILFCFYKKDKGSKITFSWSYGKQLLKKSYHFILSSLMITVYGQTDKIMLKQMISNTENGYYATAVSLCTMWCFVLSAIIDSLAPTIMQAYNENRDKFKRLNKTLYCIVFYISVVVSAIFTLFGEIVISLLYGKEYLPAVAPLKVITWYTAFSYLGVARDIWVVCENKQKYLKYIYISAAISNVIFNIILIPPLGAVGAATASLIAQIVTTMVAPCFIKDLRENFIMMREAILFKGIREKTT